MYCELAITENLKKGVKLLYFIVPLSINRILLISMLCKLFNGGANGSCSTLLDN